MKKLLKVGIIGSNFGIIGLLPAFASINNCKVVAICAKKSEALDKFYKSVGFDNVYTDWRMLLEKERLDAIALAVTPDAQYQIAKAAITKGLDVFAEKPLATNVQQAKELLTLARKKKVTHAIDFIFPEISEWKKVKELLDNKALGELKHISVDWDWLSGDIKYKKSSWKTNISEGGGVLSFYFSHGLYYLEYFAGKIINAQSLFTYSPRSSNGGEVIIDLLLQFKSKVTGSVHVSCISTGMVKHQLIFQCENGAIVLENENAIVNNFTVKIYNQSGVKQLKIVKDKGSESEDERVKIVRKLASRFVDACIDNKQTTPSFKDGVRVEELVEMIRSEKKL